MRRFILLSTQFIMLFSFSACSDKKEVHKRRDFSQMEDPIDKYYREEEERREKWLKKMVG